MTNPVSRSEQVQLQHQKVDVEQGRGQAYDQMEDRVPPPATTPTGAFGAAPGSPVAAIEMTSRGPSTIPNSVSSLSVATDGQQDIGVNSPEVEKRPLAKKRHFFRRTFFSAAAEPSAAV